MSFIIETKQNNKISFLDVNVIHEQGIFTTSVYRKPTFSGVYNHFGSFLPNTYEIGLIYTLVNRFSWICSYWSIFHSHTFKRGISEKWLSKNLIDRYFKLFLNRISNLKEAVPGAEKKLLWLVLPYLGTKSPQTRTKLQKSIEGVLKCCKLQFILRSQNNIFNNFRLKDPVLQTLTSDVVYKFPCWLCNGSYNGECIRNLAVRIGEHVCISHLTSKKIQSRKNSAVCHNLLNCNYSSTFENFSVLCHDNMKYFLELKESLLKMKGRPSMNQSIRSAPLYLFEWVLDTLLATLCRVPWSGV